MKGVGITRNVLDMRLFTETLVCSPTIQHMVIGLNLKRNMTFWSMRPPLKKSFFLAQRVAEIVASHAAANFVFPVCFWGKKIMKF